MVTIDTMRKKAKIDYPIFWSYKVIIDSSKDINIEINDIVKNRKSKVLESKVSSSGKYNSYDIKVMVDSEKDRLEIFDKLKSIAKFVL